MIKLLDHGFIRIVSYTQPVPGTAMDNWDGDLEISRNARVSYDAEPRPQDAKLISYLINNGHNTPFEAMTFTFEIMAPIFVFRQWHRHRTQAYNELSARYRPLPNTFYVPEAHLVGKQNPDNKQMRDPMTKQEFLSLPIEEQNLVHEMLAEGLESDKRSYAVYQKHMSQGMPRELARRHLPFSIYSHMFTTINLNNLFKFVGERSHTHAQYEIQVYSNAIIKLIEPIVPCATAAFKKLSKNTYK